MNYILQFLFAVRRPLAAAALLAAMACPPGLRAAGSAAAPVWPGPPAQPRLAFIESIYSPADIGVKASAWSHMSSWLTGVRNNEARLERPFGVAVDDSENLCLTDTGAGCVCYFDFRRKKFRQWKQIGGITLQSPVAVAKRGETFFVADSQLAMVLAFAANGRLLFTITNSLARPVGLALSSDRLFVADSQLHRVVVFDLTGRFDFQFGKRGVGPGEFNFPTHIAAGPRGEILVTDSMNSRIEIFDARGRFQGAVGDAGDSAGHFSRPKGVAMDSLGHVYAVDALLDNLQIFDSSGQFLLDMGSAGPGPGQFWLPSGIAIAGDNRVYIADSYNHRVQVFKYIGP